MDLNRDYRKAIFLAGVGRSGTTWISEVINYNNDYRYIFEPFHPHKVPICRHFRYRQYLEPNNTDPRFIAPTNSILSGRIRTRWSESLNHKTLCDRRLIKDIRANLLLGWLHEQFPELPIVLLLRRPCAVAASKQKLGWHTHLNEFLSQSDLMSHHLEPFRSVMEAVQTDFERHIVLWCIETYVPLKQLQLNHLHLVFYEQSCSRPAEEIRRLFDFLGLPFSQAVLDSAQRPSAQSRSDSAIISGANRMDSWHKSVSPEQTRRAMEILHRFGLDGFYCSDGLPNPEVAKNFMRATSS